MKQFFSSFLLFIGASFPLLAQVGVGTTTPKAMLDVVSPTSGVLIPRYATLSAANSTSLPTLNATDHKGLMIYVDEAANRGFWYYDGSAFVKVGSENALTFSTPLTRTNNAVSLGTVPLTNGGTGVSTANGGLNALLPTQSNNAGKVLTTDGSNTSWQKPATASRTRSIVLSEADFEVSPAQRTTLGPYQTPVLVFPDSVNTVIQSHIAIPADWNGTSPFTVTLYYSAPANSGNFYFLLAGNVYGVGSAFNPAPALYNAAYIPATSTSANTFAQYSTTTSGLTVPASSKVLRLYFQRAAIYSEDSAKGIFYLLGIRIDYQD